MGPDLNEPNDPQVSEVGKATNSSICKPPPATLVRGNFEVFPCYSHVCISHVNIYDWKMKSRLACGKQLL